MKKTMIKALVVLDKRENTWFLNGGFQEASDCHLIDVKALRVDVEDVHRTLRMVAEQAPDVLLLDSTLSQHFVLRLAIQVRDKMPNLQLLLLPDIHRAPEHLESPPLAGASRLGCGTEAGSDSIAADSIARTIRYTHGRLRLQRTLLQMALRDDLTGLHNRRGFMALATQHLKWARDAGQHMLMFFADLDGLKWINDHFGHAEGDRALSLAAACIQETFRKFDVTGRLSGDEFVALIPKEPGRSAEAICQRLQLNLADCAGAESRYKLSLSIGVAHFDPDEPVTLQELMRQADAALYQHKRKDPFSISDGLAAANSQAAANNRWLSVAPLEPAMPRG